MDKIPPLVLYPFVVERNPILLAEKLKKSISFE